MRNQKGFIHIVLLLVLLVGLAVGLYLVQHSTTFSSHAAGLPANSTPIALQNVYGAAGPTGAATGSLATPLPAYGWDEIEWPTPPDFSKTNDMYIVGKLDRDSHSCNTSGMCSSQAQVDQIYNDEVGPITTLLSRPQNLGQVWIVGNEPNNYPYISPSLYAYQYQRYWTLIKRLDPTAQITFGGVLLYGQPTSCCTTYLAESWLASFLGTSSAGVKSGGAGIPTNEYPDLINLHFYAGSMNYLPDNLQQVDDMGDWLKTTPLNGRPIIVSEFGINVPSVSATDAENAMAGYINHFKPQAGNHLAVNSWYWFIGTSEANTWDDTALTNPNGPTTPLGEYYYSLSRGIVLTPTPTPSPTPAIFCKADFMCPTGYQCVSSSCVPTNPGSSPTPVPTPSPTSAPIFCKADFMCPTGYQCVSSSCVPTNPGSSPTPVPTPIPTPTPTPSPISNGSASICGRVISQSNSSVVSQITAYPYTGAASTTSSSDQNGNFTIPLAAPGYYSLYDTLGAKAVANVTSGACTQVNITVP